MSSLASPSLAGFEPAGESTEAEMQQEIIALRARLDSLERRPNPESPPRTSLFSSAYLARAFSIWGHMLVAALIVLLLAGAAVLAVSLTYALYVRLF